VNGAALDTDERPLVAVWEVTQACELACEHCRADAQPDRHPNELSTGEGRSLLEGMGRFGEDQLVVLSGGDPLARPDLTELVSYGTELGLNMTLTPSGTSRLTGDTIERLRDAGLRRMAVSVDGARPETHDSFRGESASFQETVRAARQAAACGLPLQINTTVCQETVEELPAIRELVADLGAVLWSVFFLVPVGRGTALTQLTPSRAEEIMEWLCDVRAEESYGVKTTEAPHYRRVATQRCREEDSTATPRRTQGITAGDGFVFVSHTGDIYPSGFLPRAVGNVRSDDLVDRYRNSELFESLRDPDALQGKCGACPFRAVCGGSRSRAHATTGDPLGSDPLCAYVPDGYDGPLPEAVATGRRSDRSR